MKNILKRAISFAVIAAVMMMLFAACAKAPSDEPVKTEAVTGNVTKSPDGDAGKATDAPVATEAPTQEPTPTEEPTPEPEPTAANIEKGTNVALDAEVDVSSTTGETHVQWGWSYEYINDGKIIDTGTPPSLGWTTAVGINDDPDNEEWAEFRLAKITNIDTVKVYPTVGGSFFPTSFEIQVSMNGRDYTTVAKVENNTRAADLSEEPFVFEFDTVMAKYVRFLATKLFDVPSSLGDGILCQVAEIEIFAA
ncbi:MAG: discoidin domain-containing protein [Clostridia bacterium]|nr:discoidin domain-containing protein [Clostridia bacterium]